MSEGCAAVTLPPSRKKITDARGRTIAVIPPRTLWGKPQSVKKSVMQKIMKAARNTKT